MWVFTTPLTHKTTHKKISGIYCCPSPDVKGILAERGKWGGVFQIYTLQFIDSVRILT
ncbi:MAG: hypothetical protein RL621_267 [Bacteroidota bacterium]|jgi:hypothetical protein